MDVDLQDPPDLIPQMIMKWREGFDVVIPQRRARTGEPWIKKTVSEVGYKIIQRIANIDIPTNTGDFRLLSRRVLEQVLQLKESHGFLRGMVAIVGYKQCLVPFDRPGRFAGETNYNRFIGSLRIGFNGIFGFSSYALTLSTQFGFLVAGISFLMGLVYFVMKLRGANFPLGNPTLVILILFMGGIQLISIGILGEYIGRIYEEVRQRPKFIVDRVEGF
jgi:dolichol-phosphate mannosyltransferase